MAESLADLSFISSCIQALGAIQHCDGFKNCIVIHVQILEEMEILCNIVGPKIQKQYVVRDPIATCTRLEITLRYLANGDSMKSISYGFRYNTVCTIISEICQCIWDELKEKVFLTPTTENWRKIAKDFEVLWDYPNCIGALDGKHIDIVAPPNSRSNYYNYKGKHSINLMAINDSKCCFSIVDIGAEGR
ncbi:uncharacterized protein LOC109504126 [Harpegnathos saltator]|uniref:uncharacterized protein LOC109504126 n=1 Tax=Harpegnathos saltator TaxID=610380 RepID=UPI000DBED59C|nr:uncharacterized protein LOC109504126 [Harpegnathos saltator]